jgi:peptidoglycan glycosyltransferase
VDTNLRRLGLFFMALFLALVANVSYQQVITSADVAGNNANPRKLAREYSIARGRILAADGQTVLAESVPAEGPIAFERYYAGGAAYAHMVGYDSPQFGRSGLEAAYNEALLGEGQSEDLLRDLFNTERQGYDLVITVQPTVQEAAVNALGARRGAVVAINPDTGAILAMASYPSFDPNAIASQAKNAEGELLAEAVMSAYSRDPLSPLVNRPTMGLYPPGSSFKVLNAAAGLASGRLDPNELFDCTGVYEVGGFRVRDYGGRAHGPLDLRTALTVSCNSYFGHAAVVETASVLVDYAERFGINGRPPLDYPAVEESSIPQANQMDDAELAWTGVGQGRLLLSPLQLALIGSAVANQGQIMVPHFLKEVRDHQGNIRERFQSAVWKKPIDSAVAGQVLDMMVDVVESGTGRAAQISGYTVAGKTGTAEVEGKPNHAWFLGIAPADNPRVVVAVILENSGGTGGEEAAPVAREVLRAALAVK